MSDNARIAKLEERIREIMARPGYASAPAWQQQVAELRLEIEALRTGKAPDVKEYERAVIPPPSGTSAPQPVAAAVAVDPAVETDEEYVSHVEQYVFIFFVLAILTVLEVFAGHIVEAIQGEKHYDLWIILSVMAVAKALCVALYYMHLKSEKRPIYYILALPVILVLTLFVLLLPDAFNYVNNYVF